MGKGGIKNGQKKFRRLLWTASYHILNQVHLMLNSRIPLISLQFLNEIFNFIALWFMYLPDVLDLTRTEQEYLRIFPSMNNPITD
jgi:hypothetical protein